MKLQNHFSLKRFYKALKYDVTLNAKAYLFFAVGLFFGLFFIDFFIIVNTGKSFKTDNYIPVFFFTSIISMILIVGTSFPLLRHKKSTAHYLMFPASVFEKFLIQFLIRILCFFILFMILFWMDFKIAKAIYNLFEWRNHTEVEPFGLFAPFNYEGYKTSLDVVAAFSWLFTLASFLIAGATYFKKYALFKTILSFVLTIIFGLVVMAIFSSIYFPERFDLGRSPIYLRDYKISKNLFNVQLFFYVIGIVSSLFLLPLAYFKLKEREL